MTLDLVGETALEAREMDGLVQALSSGQWLRVDHGLGLQDGFVMLHCFPRHHCCYFSNEYHAISEMYGNSHVNERKLSLLPNILICFQSPGSTHQVSKLKRE